VILTALPVVIGVAVAYGTIGFRELLAALQNLLYGFSTENVFTQLGKLAWWHILLAPALSGLAIGLALQFLMPDKRNQGIADVMESGADLEDTLKAMEGSGEDCLPIVEDDRTMRVIGIVHHRAAIVAYNRALLQARTEEHDGR
jgi:hypothetical protein